MPKFVKRRGALLVLVIVAVAGVMLAAGAAFAQGEAAAIPAGLPWNAIAFGGMAGLQILTLAVQFAKGSAQRIDGINDQMVAQVETVEAAIEARIVGVESAFGELNSNLAAVANAFADVMNDDRIHRYYHDVECARRHEEPTPPEPKRISLPKFAEITTGRKPS